MSLATGIYRISNHFTPVVVNLNDGNPDDKTPITAFHDNQGLNQAWFVRLKSGADTYTIRNVAGGSYIELPGGSKENGTEIFAYHQDGGADQDWVIRKAPDGFYKIQNKASGTFLDLSNGGTADGTKITGSAGDWTSGGHQAWDFKSISLAAADVHKILQANSNIQQDFKNYLSESPYLVISQDHINEIWQSTGLANARVRANILDYDYFALTFKKAVSDWGHKNVKADGFAILCGVLYGKNDKGETHAYNWYTIEGDQNNIAFLDPQTGESRNDPWGFKPFFGFF